MCGSMVDIQSPTAEIWRGKKKKKDRNHRANDHNKTSVEMAVHFVAEEVL